MEPATGESLVATPTMGDPNFARSIVLLLDAGESGALGVVLNRPTELDVATVLAPWADLVVGPERALPGWAGRDRRRARGRDRRRRRRADRVAARLRRRPAWSTSTRPSRSWPRAVSSLRIFAGYAGWGAGQLEAEIERGRLVRRTGRAAGSLPRRPGPALGTRAATSGWPARDAGDDAGRTWSRTSTRAGSPRLVRTAPGARPTGLG